MVTTDVLVLGAGISGLVTAKCMRDVGLDVVVLERSGDVGGLWAYKERAYGVMKFTHMYVYIKTFYQLNLLLKCISDTQI